MLGKQLLLRGKLQLCRQCIESRVVPLYGSFDTVEHGSFHSFSKRHRPTLARDRF
jgi:hypothetical protein